LAGGEDELISALKSAKVTKPATVDPALQARQTEVRKHVARGLAFYRSKRYADAEAEYRAAHMLDPQNAVIHAALGEALAESGDLDGEVAEYRTALFLDPNNEFAHTDLGGAFGDKRDVDGAIAEDCEALTLNPNNKGDWKGEVSEAREAVRLKPNSASAHFLHGSALEQRHNYREALQEYRTAYELDPQGPDYRKAYEHLLHRINKR